MAGAKLERFERSVKLFRSSRARKIARAPVNYLHTSIMETIAKWCKNGFRTKARLLTGDKMTVVLPEEVSIALRRYGFYEEGLTRMLLERLKPGMTFFDIGAHFGYYTLLGSWLVGSEGQVHSFEPTPNTFNVLEANVKGKSNVHANPVGISCREGVATLNDLGLKYSGRNSIHRAKVTQADLKRIAPTTIDIQTTTVDAYAGSKNVKPDFVKIDAESSEYEILQGMSETLEKCRPLITLEVGDMGIEGVPSSNELVQYLSGKGYEAYEFNHREIQKHRLLDWYQWDNLLFVPKQSDV